MIDFSFRLHWPWFKPIENWQKDYFCNTYSVTKNKSLEIQLSKAGKTLIGVSLDTSARCSHAGIMFEISLFRYFFVINFYDNRHWNDEAGRYVDYDNKEEVEKYW